MALYAAILNSVLILSLILNVLASVRVQHEVSRTGQIVELRRIGADHDVFAAIGENAAVLNHFPHARIGDRRPPRRCSSSCRSAGWRPSCSVELPVSFQPPTIRRRPPWACSPTYGRPLPNGSSYVPAMVSAVTRLVAVLATVRLFCTCRARSGSWSGSSRECTRKRPGSSSPC